MLSVVQPSIISSFQSWELLVKYFTKGGNQVLEADFSMSGNKHDFGRYAGILGLHCYLTFNYILKEPNEIQVGFSFHK